MNAQPERDTPGLGPATDISVDALGEGALDAADRPATADPDAFDGDPTLGGQGGADTTAGGAG